MKRLNVLACVVALCLVLPSTIAAITVRITPDGTGDLPDIQTALNTCASGDTILVAPGVFHEQIVWPATNGLVLLGETAPEDCILDGESTFRPVTIGHPVDETTVIKGLTIQNGLGSGILCSNGAAPVIEDNIILECWGNSGGGIYCPAASPTIRNNTIHDCSAGTGGGIRCDSGSTSLIVGNNIFANSSTGIGGGGIAIGGEASPTIRDNWIHENESVNGGGIGVVGSGAATITDNLLENNHADNGGGLVLWGNSNQVSGLVAQNEFRGNTSSVVGGGILVGEDVDTVIRNNLVQFNEAVSSGGGFHLTGTGVTVTIAGNLILDNISPGGAGITNADGASPTIDGNLLRDNVGHGVYCRDGGNPLIRDNDIHGHFGSYGVLNDDETVMVMAEDNYWGSNSGPFHPSGNPSGLGDWVSDFVDFDPWRIISGDDTPAAPGTPILYQNQPNPFNPKTMIAFTVATDERVRLTVHAMDGRLVATLLDARVMAGRNEVAWNGQAQDGRPLPSGVYFYRLTSGDFAQTNRMVLVR